MKELTKAEEQVMQVLWKARKGFVKDLLGHFRDPKPAYNTVSTVIRLLEEKGYVSHRAYGRTYEYYPLISKEAYSKMQVRNLVRNYFANSFEKMVSYFAREKDISIKEMEEILKIMEKEVKKHKSS